MRRDPLSEILEMIDARTVYAGGFIGGGNWAIRFPPPEKIKFFAIARGRCLLLVEGIDEPFRLGTGDVFLLTKNVAFTVASDLSMQPLPAAEVFANADTTIISVGEGDDFLFLGAHLDTDQAGGRLMIESLPDALHLPAGENDAGRLRTLVTELVQEAASRAPGAEIACASLAQLLMIQILRRHLSGGAQVEAGWLRAACDPRLVPALSLMHANPAHAWTLPELARASAMSRTAFATYFKGVAGIPPLTYLTEWRMRQADRALKKPGSSVARVAQAVGYGSEAAFSTAFKRVMGRSPRRDRRIGADPTL